MWLEELPKDGDWYQSKVVGGKPTLLRTTILSVLFLMKDRIRRHVKDAPMISNSEYEEEIADLRRTGFVREKQVTELKWSRIKEILRNMVNRYHREKTHTKFEAFILEARELWRRDLEKLRR